MLNQLLRVRFLFLNEKFQDNCFNRGYFLAPSLDLNCNFDNDYCSWKNFTGVGNLQWRRAKTESDSPISRPPGDHTNGGINHFNLHRVNLNYLKFPSKKKSWLLHPD